ncbi:hypothetical protein EVAR_37337_1 [Eumeta japonica]|uniref:Uncharacterized protein n=1 Tax=Eumeta variegata TaxID=151549 RepID=A0A4C1WZW7_EUMVA|nr:hypothetical protein EVAR_37337_1 [Eumeta japonica]
MHSNAYATSGQPVSKCTSEGAVNAPSACSEDEARHVARPRRRRGGAVDGNRSPCIIEFVSHPHTRSAARQTMTLPFKNTSDHAPPCT